MNKALDARSNADTSNEVSDRQLALFSALSYCDIPCGTVLTDISGEELKNVNVRFGDSASLSELEGFTVIKTEYGNHGFQASVYKSENNTVLAFRGTNDRIDWVNNILTYLFGISFYTFKAKRLTKAVIRDNPESDLYFTGHSLGGHLAMNAASFATAKSPERVKKVSSFNALAFSFGLFVFFDLTDYLRLRKSNAIIRCFSVNDDPVSSKFLGKTTKTPGERIKYERSEHSYSSHDLYTFIEKL